MHQSHAMLIPFVGGVNVAQFQVPHAIMEPQPLMPSSSLPQSRKLKSIQKDPKPVPLDELKSFLSTKQPLTARILSEYVKMIHSYRMKPLQESDLAGALAIAVFRASRKEPILKNWLKEHDVDITSLIDSLITHWYPKALFLVLPEMVI